MRSLIDSPARLAATAALALGTLAGTVSAADSPEATAFRIDERAAELASYRTADAAKSVPAQQTRQETVPDDKRIRVYVLGNTVWTLYHELGHALIDLYDLPVLGREEDAADQLAIMMMLADEAGVMRDQMAIDAAWYWFYADREAQGYETPVWDEHSLSLQRFYRTVCYIYGSDPERFEHVADRARLPSSERAACERDQETTHASWTKVLEPHAAQGQVHGRVESVFDEPAGDYAGVARLVEASGLADEIARKVQEQFRLPRNLTIRFRECGEENAFYDPGKRSIIICYEELAHFNRQITTNQPPPDGRRR